MIKYSVMFQNYRIKKIQPYEILLRQYSSLKEYIEFECGKGSWNYVSKIYAMHESGFYSNIFKVHEVKDWETLEECSEYYYTDECGNRVI